MRKRLLAIALLTPLFVGVMSCANEADPEADKKFFTRFYDDAIFNEAYTPLDVVPTNDGGYLVLATKRAVDMTGTDVKLGQIYIMKADAFGGFVSHVTLKDNLGMPAPSIMQVGDKYYFFCMDLGTFSIQLMEVGEDGVVNQQLNVGGAYPLAAGVDLEDKLMLLHFDAGARTTVMSTVSTDGHVAKTKGFNIGASDGGPYAPEGVIIDHVNKQGKQLPFFVGQLANGLYYFNGIYNYGLTLIFTDLNATNPIGYYNGYNDDGGFSAMAPVAAGKFAAARFNFGDNYILPSVTLSPTSRDVGAAELGGLAFPELTANAPVVIRTVTVNGAERVLIGSNTRGKQIGLFAYSTNDGSLTGKRYLGFSNTFELASMSPTVDGGLVVLGTTYIAGRFPRICMFRLSAEALSESFF